MAATGGSKATSPAPNPLKVDPTRLTTLRRTLLSQVRRRFNVLRRKLRIGLFTDEAGERAFGQSDTARRVERFQDLVGHEMLGTVLESQWWKPFVQKAYQKALGRSYREVKRPSTKDVQSFVGGQAQFLQMLNAAPNARQQMELLSLRFESELKGATAVMAQQIARELLDGLGRGAPTSEIADAISRRVGVTSARAETIARTEVTRAHAEGQLDALEALGVQKVDVAAEWVNGGTPCERCQPMVGAVLSVHEARNLIPRHPNCQCAYRPITADSKKELGKTPKKLLTRSARESVKSESGKGSTSWPGKKLIPGRK